MVNRFAAVKFHSARAHQRLANFLVKSIYIFILASLVSVSASTWAAAIQDNNLVFGVFPHLPPREIEKVYAPIAAIIGKKLGCEVTLRTSSSYEKFMEKLDQQVFDVVFTQPFDYVKAADKSGYIPLATRDEPLEAILVVKQGKPITDVTDIKGMRIAMPPKVAAVSRLFISYLSKHNVDPDVDVRFSFHRSHVSCLQQVIIGAVDACATAAPALRFFNHKMEQQLVAIMKTDGIPHTLFAVHPRVIEANRNKILAEILSWSSTAKGKLILKRGKFKPFIKISDQDYDVVRSLIKNSQY